ncbi:MAG: PQQ-like beta-propeller repeat protein [Lentisphaeraceae bacterium]|nr:PQQ-like beta-propeller repeat protein [Lentisphaeraceae bacterium]
MTNSSDSTKINPMYVGDPESDYLQREVNALLSEKVGKEAFSRLLRLIRSKGYQLFQSGLRKMSLRGYVVSSLKAKEVFKDQFSKYIQDRYEDDVKEAIKERDLEELEDLLREIDGLAKLPKARAFLMRQNYNSGDYKKSLRDAHLLKSNTEYAQEAYGMIIHLENWLEVASKDRTEVPAEYLNQSIKVAGRDVKLSDLYKKLELKNSVSGPGKFVLQLPLAEIDNPALMTDPGESKDALMKLPRQPSELLKYKDLWIASSPFEIVAYDEQGNIKWSKSKPVHTHDSYSVYSNKVYRPQVVDGLLFNLEFPRRGSFVSLIARNELGKVVWSSSSHPDFDKWEVCSLPYNLHNTTVTLVMEKQRTTAPVVGLAFMNHRTGKLNKIIPIARIRDPYMLGRSSKESEISRFNDCFTQDNSSIYVYTGSGQVIKVNAYNEEISWVSGQFFRIAGYHGEAALNWKRASSAAPAYIQKIDDLVVNFDASRMVWRAIDQNSGKTVWRNYYNFPAYIHSRNSSQLIFTSIGEREEHKLVKLDPKTGEVLLQKSLFGLRITGEGVLRRNSLFVPVEEGIAKLDLNGELQSLMKTSAVPLKLRSEESTWQVLTKDQALIYESGEKFENHFQRKVKNVKLVAEKSDFEDLKFKTFEKLVDFPFSLSNRRNGVKVFRTSNPLYYLIQADKNVALLQESYMKGSVYSEPRIVWNNRFSDFEVHGDYILSKSSDKIEVFNFLKRRTVFSYETPSKLMDIRNSKSSFAGAGLSGDKLYILNRNGKLNVFNINSGKQLPVELTDVSRFILNGDHILAFKKTKNSYTLDYYKLASDFEKVATVEGKFKDVRYSLVSEKYIGWFAKNTLQVFSTLTKKVKNYSGFKSGGWRLIGDRAVLQNKVVDLVKGDIQKVEKTVLCSDNAAVVFEGDKLRYVGPKGQVELEVVDRAYARDRKDNKEFLDTTRESYASSMNGQLSIANLYAERVYSLKTGKMLMDRKWSSRDSYRRVLYTAKSMIPVRDSKAFFFSSLAHKLPVSPIVRGEVATDDLSWTALDKSKWISTKGAAFDAAYKLSVGQEDVNILVRLKGTSKTKESVYFSVNSPLEEEHVYSGYSEGQPTKDLTVELLKEQSEVEHYFDADGYEYFSMSLPFTQNLQKLFNGHYNLEIRSKKGFYAVGGMYAPSAYRLYLTAPKSRKLIGQTELQQLEELYTKTSCFVADGYSFSAFIKNRRGSKGFEDNIKLIESLLTKHAKNYSSINVLTSLLLEKVEKQMSLDKFSDASLKKALSECRSFAKGAKMKQEWIDYALTFFMIDVRNQNQSLSGPYEMKMNYGSERARMTLDGRIQSGVRKSGTYLFPLGLFTSKALSKLHQLEIRYDFSLETVLGSLRLVQNDKVTELITSEGEIVSPLISSQTKDAIRKVYLFEGENREKAYKVDRNRKITFKDIQLPKVSEEYEWTEDSLLENIKLNPINEAMASNLLRKWLELKKVEDSKFIDVCVDILKHSPDNYRLVQGVIKIYLEKFKDPSKVKDILKAARVSRDSRRRVFVDMASMDNWYILGPLYNNKELEKELKFTPPPHKVMIDPKREFMDEDERLYIFEKNKKYERRGNGLAYYWLPIVAEKSGKAFFHFKTNSYDSSATLGVWLNGKPIYESFLREDDSSVQAVPLDLREGKNFIVVKYNYRRSISVKMKIGDVYGADSRIVKSVEK